MKRAFWLSLLFVLLVVPVLAQKHPTVAENPYKPVLDRLKATSALPIPDWRIHSADFAHPEEVSVNDADWATVKVNEPWDAAARWLRLDFTVPQKVGGYDVTGSKMQLDLWMASNEGEDITVFSNGTVVARTDEDMQLPITLTNNAQPGEKFVIAVRVLSRGDKTRVYRSQMLFEPPSNRPEPSLFAEEVLSVQPLINAYEEGKAEREKILGEAVKTVDVAALDKGDQSAFDASLRNAQLKLDELRPYMKNFAIHATGNSHIDMAWLWPETETVEVTRNTFASVLQLMREYPQLTFTMATAQTYAWMEEKYPSIFDQIKQRVKEGRWEIVGGMWVEPDLNLPDGESLARQLLYGKRYFQQKFGVDVKIGWNPDSFGYNWQLPQIYKRAGVDYFVTQKIYWNDTTKFPYKLFRWEAPDGSSLLTYFPHDYANKLEPAKMANDLSQYAPAMWKANPIKSNLPDGTLSMMFLFGIGDHGGGPTRKDLDTGLRWQKKDVVFPELHFDTAMNYFEELHKNEADLNVPTWKNELYFEYHRGVQTTQAETKKGNRKSEVAMLNAEKLASIDTLFGAKYPKDEFEKAWKKVLFNQFHDILPGSGIAVNYKDAALKYEEVERAAREITGNALADLAANVKVDGTSVLVFNPLSWPRTDMVEAEVQFPTPVKSVSATVNGKPVLVDVIGRDEKTDRVRVRMLAENVPAMGYMVVKLNPAAGQRSAALKATVDHLENEFLKATIDPKTGCITSLIDKRSGKESLAPAKQSEGSPANLDGKPCGNLLQTFVDKPKDWDAWNIDADFTKQHTDLMQADSVELVENTPTRAVLRVKKHTPNSKFVQDITLYPGVDRLDVRMQADWNEKHVLLKVAFPVNATNDKASFEIPYGSIERPTTRRTPAEQAQFEVPALRWADLSDSTGGLSLLNDSKYGYDAKDNVLRLSLLRSPTWPDPHADEGHHEFTYSLYPHAGSWQQAMTIRRGYELNYPLLAEATQSHEGPLPAQKSFFSTDAENVIISAVKQAEDDDSIIVRLFEWGGKAADVKLHLPFNASAASDVNLMEKSEQPLSMSPAHDEVTVPVKPFEIRTVRLVLKK